MMPSAKPWLKAVLPVCLLAGAVTAYLMLGRNGGVVERSNGEPVAPEVERASRTPDTGTGHAPPGIADHRLSTFVDRQSKEPRVTGDITIRIPKVTDTRDVEAVSTVLADTKDDDTVRNEAANLLRRSGYPRLTGELIKVLNSPEEKERFRSFCVQHLFNNHKKAGPAEKEKIASTLRKCLTDRHVKVRREALLALHRLKDDKAEKLARKWLHEEGEKGDAVRDLAIRIVRERRLQDELPTIRKLARDKNVVIRIAALVTLSEWRDEESRPAMKDAAGSDNVRLQRCGRLALKRLDEPLPAPKAEPAGEPPTQAPAQKDIDGF